MVPSKCRRQALPAFLDPASIIYLYNKVVRNLQKRLAHRVAAFRESVKRHDLLLALLIAVTMIAAGTVLGWANNKVIPAYPKAHFHYTAEPNNPLSFLSNWDGPDYLKIVHHGYKELFDVNFFPLYPLIIRGVSVVVRSALVSALLISWISLVGAIYFYIQILRREGVVRNTDETLRAVSMFVLFPTGIFLIATYTESVYALLALAAIYYALQRKYVRTSLLLLLTSACHITGIFVVVLAAIILWEQKEKLRNIIFTVCVGSLGLLAYMAYLWKYFHDPLAFIKSQKEIHEWLHHGYTNLITGADPFNILFVILLIVTAVYFWRRKRISFAVYSLLLLTIPLVGRQYGGFNRYVLMAFPLQFMLYQWLRGKKQIYPYALACMAMIWTYFALQYAGGYIGS